METQKLRELTVPKRRESFAKESACKQETWVQFLGWEDPQEKEMATHSSVLAWRIPLTKEPGR